MNRLFPRAEDLNQEEVDYELMIRNQPQETFLLDFVGKQRVLRSLFREDQSEGRNYRCNVNIRDEASYVEGRMSCLEKSLSKKSEPRLESKVLHYWYRVKRALATNDEEKKMRRDLTRRIESLMQDFQFGPPLSPVKDHINNLIQGAEGGTGLVNQSANPSLPAIPAEKQSTPDRSKGAIPKQTPVSSKVPNSIFVPSQAQQGEGPTIVVSKKEWDEMKSALADLMGRLNSNQPGAVVRPREQTEQMGYVVRREEGDKPIHGQWNPTPRYHIRNRDSDSSDEDRRRDVPRSHELRRNNHRQRSDTDGSEVHSTSRYSDHRDRDGDRDRHHHRRTEGYGRVEKWKLRFSGDPRLMSVESFLYKAKKLAEREGVPRQVLLRDIHMLLEGSASDWFFTYVDDLDTWEAFEAGITFRFGNPNMDQGIRSKIQDRRQQRGEPFIAFVSEIEKLNRMLSQPLSRRRKFEVIWDNMRQHYRSKISIVEVKDLQQLIKLNHRIDAADPQLQQISEGPIRRPVNQIDAEYSDSEMEQEASINAVQGRSNGEQMRLNGRSNLRPTRELHTAVGQQAQSNSLGACWNCQEMGHAWRQCVKPKLIFCYGWKRLTGWELGSSLIPTKNKIPDSTLNALQFDPLTQVYHIKIQVSKCPHIKIKIFDAEIEALLDSGAGISILNSLDIINRFSLQIQPAAIRVSTADGTNYECLGSLNLPLTYKNVTKVIPIIVVPEISRQLILGADFWDAFNIKPMIDLGCGPEELETVIQNTNTQLCFTVEPGDSNVQIVDEEDDTLDIPVYEGPTESTPDPDGIETEHNLSAEERRNLIDVIKTFELTSTGVLGRTHLIEHKITLKKGAIPRNPPVYKCSPYVQTAVNAELERFRKLDAIEECQSEWTNPLVPVLKKDGKVRVCLDSRKINKLTIKDTYPMKNMQDIFHRLEKARYFSVIDLKDAYFQIPLEPKVFVYLDDIVIASETFKEHLKLLKIVAERLRKANLTISLDKSRFCRKQVVYLGYLLNEHGVAIGSSRIEPILNYARPKSQQDIRRLMGLAGFYQRFIQNYSKITAPITDLLSKEHKRFTWTKEAEKAFNELKSVLTSAPILGNPDFTKKFTIESDASDRAVGAALVQEQEGETRVISYFSKKLNRTQRRYAAVEKECLGVLSAIHHFRHYVEGTKFRVVTDARSLLWLFNLGTETGNAKLLRWALRIQAYDFDLEYRKGKSNILADCLSRAVEIDTIAVSYSDPEQDELMEKIREDPAKNSDWRIIDDKLYRYVRGSNRQSDSRFAWKYYPPSSQRTEIMRKEHEKAHFGFAKTLAALKQHFYWKKMNEDIRNFCRECLKCQSSKAGNQNVTPPMGIQKPVQYPWQFVTLDYVGPLPPSGRNRNTCLLVATDVFSKFVLVQPFREAKANSLVEFVENMIFRLFGVPEIMLTDNGSQFVSKAFKALLDSYHVTHWLTPAYHPQVNNTERVNHVITTAIRATIKKDHSHWADNIQLIADAIRTAVHDSTKYDPYFVVFGRNKVSDGREYSWIRDNYEPSGEEGNAKEERKKLFEEVKTNLAAAYQKHAKTYNLRSNAQCATYDVGERVWKQTFELSDKGKGFCKKLAPKYEPAVVRKVLGSNTYELEDDAGKRLGVYFANKLKKMHSHLSQQ
ncbi:uncharacterized protein LOC128740057 [Sabethes cyaneus]|uniref:uncharacterized protein LOC128740057 n=1 Tax=Sabethes cyaneus TaxID=53552 RepID=UPI00237EC783|nr:uncharacterized protein LOC128740057 [Sabethes cyaneus]